MVVVWLLTLPALWAVVRTAVSDVSLKTTVGVALIVYGTLITAALLWLIAIAIDRAGRWRR